MVPTRERFEFAKPPRAELDNRLVRHVDRSRGKRLAYFRDEDRVIVPAARFSVGLVEAESPTTLGLGFAQRTLSLFEQSVGSVGIRTPGRAQSGRDRQQRAVYLEGFGDQALEPTGQSAGLLAALDHPIHAESIPAETDDEIVGSN